MSKVAVIGAGAWGTALATVVARSDAASTVALWARSPEGARALGAARENAKYLPGIRLDAKIEPTSDAARLRDATAIVLAVPTQSLGETLERLAPHLPADIPYVITAKGIERKSGRFLGEVVSGILPSAQICVLSGPSFAADVARDLPTAVTLAASEATGLGLLDFFRVPTFRIYLSTDVIGAEVGGAAKNVLAIACGIVIGRGLGESARAALISRGFAELMRFGLALGAQVETLAGLSGLGDLVLTCGSLQSRNMAFGHALGKGASLETATAGSKGVVEGVATAPALLAMAERLGVDMPITAAVAAVTQGKLDVDAAIEGLLARPLKTEDDDSIVRP